MISLLLVAIFWMTVATNPEEQKLPELNKIKTATLSPSYSCRSRQEFTQGYAKTALFVSGFSELRNSPDLLFNGACGSEDYFEGPGAGDDMSLIADLGTEPLEEITAPRAFNLKRIHSFNLFSKFSQVSKVETNHTYALLIDSTGVRGLVLFTVTAYKPNTRVELRYAVKKYQILHVEARSEGFNWDTKNETENSSNLSRNFEPIF